MEAGFQLGPATLRVLLCKCSPHPVAGRDQQDWSLAAWASAPPSAMVEGTPALEHFFLK